MGSPVLPNSDGGELHLDSCTGFDGKDLLNVTEKRRSSDLVKDQHVKILLDMDPIFEIAQL